MASLSLARIMYGTSEDLHASTITTVSALSSKAFRPGVDAPQKGEQKPESLAGRLQRAWDHFTAGN